MPNYPVEFILSLIGYLHTLKWAEKEEVERGGGERERERERERINISFACLWRGNWVAF